jgi:hypothetical protein
MTVQRLLVRLPNPLGDAVMATPALRALRRGLPDAGDRRDRPPSLTRGFARQPQLRRVSCRCAVAVCATSLRARARCASRGFDAALLLPRLGARRRSTRSPRGSRCGSATRATRCDAPAQRRDRARRASAAERVAISMIERYLRLARCARRARRRATRSICT